MNSFGKPPQFPFGPRPYEEKGGGGGSGGEVLRGGLHPQQQGSMYEGSSKGSIVYIEAKENKKDTILFLLHFYLTTF
jgi:hypothetical protein